MTCARHKHDAGYARGAAVTPPAVYEGKAGRSCYPGKPGPKGPDVLILRHVRRVGKDRDRRLVCSNTIDHMRETVALSRQRDAARIVSHAVDRPQPSWLPSNCRSFKHAATLHRDRYV